MIQLKNKTILITGGAGFLGAALVERLYRYNKIVVLDNNPEAIVKMSSVYDKFDVDVVVGSIEDEEFVNYVFSKHLPDIVFHCASIKDVARCHNFPLSAISVNILGTMNLARAADKYLCEAFIFVSSVLAEKAETTYGMTKLLGEKIIQQISECSIHEDGNGCRFVSCRLCNIYGSPGSVVDIFRKKIFAGEKLQIKANEYRTFMALDTAVDFLMKAYENREQGQLFVCESGVRCSIEDIARRVCEECGVEMKDLDFEVV